MRKRPLLGKVMYVAAWPVVLAWLLLAGGLNLVVPQLETVITGHAQSFLPDSSPSVQAIAKMGQHFGGTGTNNFVYLLLESDAPLGKEAHRYSAEVLAALAADHRHVISVMDLWSDPDFAAANQSADGKAAYTLVNLRGNMGTALAMESTQAMRDAVAAHPPPEGMRTYVTGPSAIVNDELVTIAKSIVIILATCTLLVGAILFAVYRSPITVAVPLLTVGLGLVVARPVVALLGEHGVIGVSIFASALMSVIILGAGTDYGIFLLGRYQEARRAGEDPQSAYYTALRGTQHIILASGLTVAGATACMCVTRLAIFSTAGLPCTIGILITLAAALTLGPALLALGSRMGFLEPRPQSATRRWHRIATVVVRYPVPVLAGSIAVLALLVLVVPTIRLSYDERIAQPGNTPSNLGFIAADRHFPPNIMAPSLLVVEADHDMRNPADLLALAKLTDAILHIDGVSNVQGITRPLGVPLQQATLPNQIGYIGARLDQTSTLISQRLSDIDTLTASLGQLDHTVTALQSTLAASRGGLDQTTANAGQLQSLAAGLATQLAAIRDTAQPVHQFLDDAPGCTTHPVCQTAQTGWSLFTEIDRFNAPLAGVVDGTRTAAAPLAKLNTQLGSLKTVISSLTGIVGPLHATLATLSPQIAQISEFADELRSAYGAGVPGASYFLPTQALSSPLFQRVLPLLFSADGTVTRMVVTPEVEGFSAAAMEVSRQMIPTALQAIKTTSLAGSTVSIGGPGGTLLNIEAYAHEDFTTSIVAALAFIFCVVLLLLRSLVAALTVVGTVALSYLTALGLTVLIWQHLLDQPLHWSVPPIAFAFLVAVGADYNLLLVARFREEQHAGINTGIIRSMVNTGGVVTTAGLVFGFTMFGMLVSPAHNVAQIGTTVGIGLLLDTLIVRSFVIPTIAATTHRWFWWPQEGPYRHRPSWSHQPTGVMERSHA